MKIGLHKYIMVGICMCLMGCSSGVTPKETAVSSEQTSETVYADSDASKEIVSEAIVSLDTSFRRFDEDHNDVSYHFTIRKNTYGETIMEESESLHARAVLDEAFLRKFHNLFRKYGLFEVNGIDVLNDAAFAGETTELYVVYDSGEVLAFRTEHNAYEKWTEDFLELFEEAEKNTVVEQWIENTGYAIGVRLCGTYIDPNDEYAGTYELTMVDGRLYLEYRSIYEYWGAEFEPSEAGAQEDTESDSLSGMFYVFSGFSLAGNYRNDGTFTTMTLSNNGVLMDVHPNGDDRLELVRSKTALPIHRYAEAAAMIDADVPGIWRVTGETDDNKEAALILEKDGSATIIVKELGKPMVMEKGVMTTAGDGILILETQRFGFGSMPSVYNLEYSISGTGLYLRNREGNFMGKPEESKWVLERSEEGEHEEGLVNGPITQHFEAYVVNDGFADDEGRYYFCEAEGNGLFYIDEETEIDETAGLYAYMEGESAVEWAARLLDPASLILFTEGSFDITVTGGHIDIVHGMTNVY